MFKLFRKKPSKPFEEEVTIPKKLWDKMNAQQELFLQLFAVVVAGQNPVEFEEDGVSIVDSDRDRLVGFHPEGLDESRRIK